ncbi:MAG: type IV pilus assembly protein PilM [Phycisphaerae bacterium]|jgi:type IV pilus assembly protein PilM
MAGVNAVWGIEIGQCALKAVKLRVGVEGKVELVAFDVIPHAKILSQPDAEPEELMRAALEKFASRNDWQGDKFVIGVPGHQTFARFCKLPPVDEKKIPDIVRFEASQQIPFNMDDVVWDYQVFRAPDMPDVEVGIFAMRKELIRKHLDRLAAFGITPMMIQTIPTALYNFARYEGLGGDKDGAATVIVDVGTQHTDLVIVEKHSAWTRNIPLGGNHFTEALVKAFKLSFAKAEALKCTAATSKYARQVFQAMRPVFADLVAEIQRSLGFYAQTHREVELSNVIACGNAFRLPGLQKYLENNITVEGGVQKLDAFKQIAPSATANAPQFTEMTPGLGPAYGLALQGLGLGTITSNLLPPELARVAMWHRKRPLFVAAAACVGLAALFPWMRNSMDASALAANESKAGEVIRIVNQVQQLQTRFREAQTDSTGRVEKINKLFSLLDQRDLIPRLVAFVYETLPPADPQIAAATGPEQVKKAIESDPARLKRTRRKQIFIESLDIQFSNDIDNYEPRAFGAGGSGGSSGAGISEPAPEEEVGGTFGGAMAGGGGRGRMRQQAPAPAPKPSPAADAQGATAGAGFYIGINAYSVYGDNQPEAATLIADELIPTIQRLGQVVGRGFYVPEQDPRSPNGKNLRFPSILKRFDAAAAQASLPPAPAAGAGAGPADTKPKALFPDPVTGEDMVTDWRFQIGFKVKLGDPPPPAPGAQPTKEGE